MKWILWVGVRRFYWFLKPLQINTPEIYWLEPKKMILFKSYFAVGNSVQYVARTTNEKLKLKRIEESKREVHVQNDFFGATKNTMPKGTSSKKYQDLKLKIATKRIF
jgi:hypothetical protein